MIELELLAIGALLLVCIAIQAFTLTALQRRFPAIEAWFARHQSFMSDVLVVYVVIVAVVGMHVAQACVWGAFYRYVVGIDSIRDAFYHSILALTTMDDGSGVLPDRWRMLGPAEGLTGWMVFSWSTAWTFMFLTTLRDARKPASSGSGKGG